MARRTLAPFLAPMLAYFGALAIVGLIAAAFADAHVPAAWLGVTLLASYGCAAAALWLLLGAIATGEAADEASLAQPEAQPEAPLRLVA